MREDRVTLNADLRHELNLVRGRLSGHRIPKVEDEQRGHESDMESQGNKHCTPDGFGRANAAPILIVSIPHHYARFSAIRVMVPDSAGQVNETPQFIVVSSDAFAVTYYTLLASTGSLAPRNAVIP